MRYLHFLNLNVFPALLIGIISFYLAGFILKRINNKIASALIFLVLVLISLPALSFMAYYLKIIKLSITYIEYRAIPGIEIFSGFIGGLFAFIVHKTNFKLLKLKKVHIPILLILVLTPFLKNVFNPIRRYLPDDWKDGVCLQSSSSTCGPSSLATILKYYGKSPSEQDLAEKCFSSRSGTEIWYLMRAVRKMGYKITPYKVNNLNEARIPSILGTTLRGTVGHFVTILGKNGDQFIIGDPLIGKITLPQSEFEKKYYLNDISFFIER